MANEMKTADDLSAAPTALEHEAYNWVVRFISGEAGPEDIKALKAWAAQSRDHAAAFDQASKVWQATESVTRTLPSNLSGVRRSTSISSGPLGSDPSGPSRHLGRRPGGLGCWRRFHGGASTSWTLALMG